MQLRTKKYLFDIESAIGEIENLVERCERDFNRFANDPFAIRSLERLLEIIGEATGKALRSDDNLTIPHSDNIIALRNRLAHAYDSIDLALIWGIAIKNIPDLKKYLSKL